MLATPLPLALGRLRWAGTRKILSKYCYVGAWRPCWLAGATPQYAGLAGTWPPGLLLAGAHTRLLLLCGLAELVTGLQNKVIVP